MKKFSIACISGSMRFADNMILAAAQLSQEGFIVVMPFVTFAPGSEQESDQKAMLDEMHLAKIDMADVVYVVSDPSGYYGESTEREIEYAKACKIPVWFLKVGTYFATDTGVPFVSGER